MYQIEKGIPFPEGESKHKTAEGKKTTNGLVKLIATYIEVGESVLFPTYFQAKNLVNQLGKQGKKGSLRTLELNKEYRVWRIH